MSIPENALIMRNDKFGTESVAYRNWADLRTDFLKMFPDMTAEELDDLEAQPENESEIFRADLKQQENEDTGMYNVEYFKHAHIYGEGNLYRIHWDEARKYGDPKFYGYTPISVVTKGGMKDSDLPDPEDLED